MSSISLNMNRAASVAKPSRMVVAASLAMSTRAHNGAQAQPERKLRLSRANMDISVCPDLETHFGGNKLNPLQQHSKPILSTLKTASNSNSRSISTALSPAPQPDIEHEYAQSEDSNVLPPHTLSPRLVPGSSNMSEIMRCVVKVFVTSSSPNYLQPWQSRALQESMGSGFIIKGKKILTNAHVIADAVQVMVRRPGSPHKYVAKVVAAGHECDLALLDVDDMAFWNEGLDEDALEFDEGNATDGYSEDVVYNDGGARGDIDDADYEEIVQDLIEEEHHEEIQASENKGNTVDIYSPSWAPSVFAPDNDFSHLFAQYPPSTSLEEIPDYHYPKQHHIHGSNKAFHQERGVLYLSRQVPLLQQSVVVVGYPLGGDNLCITQGVVSRVEPVTYAHTGSYLLAVQIDAAINPGNSGGPALAEGRVVGVAFQNVTNASSVGYIIPNSVILHFLRDVSRGGYKIEDRGMSRKQALSRKRELSTNNNVAIDNMQSLQKEKLRQKLGFCGIGLNCQDTHNPSLQQFIGIHSNNNSTHNIASTQQGSISGMIVGEVDDHATKKLMKGIDVNAVDSVDAASHVKKQSNQLLPMSEIVDKVRKEGSYTYVHYNNKYTLNKTPAAHLHYQHIDNDQGNNISIDFDITQTQQHSKKVTRTLGADRISGVLVLKVSTVSPCLNVLKRGDVLLAIDDHEVASDGSVHYRGHERIGFDYLFTLKHVGDLCKLTYLRKNSNDNTYSLQSSYIAMHTLPQLVPSSLHNKHPSYYIFSGLVFLPLSIPYLLEFGKDWWGNAPRELVEVANSNAMTASDEECVLLSQVLPSEGNVGYNMMDAVVKLVDGVKVGNVKECKLVVERVAWKSAIAEVACEIVNEYGISIVQMACDPEVQYKYRDTIINLAKYHKIPHHMDLLFDSVNASTTTQTTITTTTITTTTCHNNNIDIVENMVCGTSNDDGVMHINNIINLITDEDVENSGIDFGKYQLNNITTLDMDTKKKLLFNICRLQVLMGVLSQLSSYKYTKDYNNALMNNLIELLPKTSSYYNFLHHHYHQGYNFNKQFIKLAGTDNTSTNNDNNSVANIVNLNINNTNISLMDNLWHYLGVHVCKNNNKATFTPISINNSICVELGDQRMVVLDIKKAVTSHYDVIYKHNIHYDCSMDINESENNC